MKNLPSNLQEELMQLKATMESAKEARKLAKEAYKAQYKVLKKHLKPFKQAYKQVQALEEETKAAYKNLLKELKATVQAEEVPATETADETVPAATKEVAPVETGTLPARTTTPEDLTKIRGIGVSAAKALNEAGIRTYAQLATTSVERFKQILRDAGIKRYRTPANLVKAAEALIGAAPAPEKEKGKRTSVPKKASSPEKESAKPAAPPVKKARAPKAAPATQEDDLTRVKGVGPRVAEVLKAYGITSFTAMAITPVERFRDILRKNNMSKYRNPANWPEIAAALASGTAPAPNAKSAKPAKPATTKTAAPKKPAPSPPPPVEAGTKAPAKAKAAAKPNNVAPTTTKSAKAPAKPTTAKSTLSTKAPAVRKKTAPKAPAADSSVAPNDLTKIKGIGDRIVWALNKSGINTLSDVAATSFERFKEILKEHGMSKYRNPATWAAQAKALLQSEPKAKSGTKK